MSIMPPEPDSKIEPPALNPTCAELGHADLGGGVCGWCGIEIPDLTAVMAEHRPDGGIDGPGAMCVTCTPGFGTPAEDPVPYPCVPLGRALLAAARSLRGEV